MKKPGHFIALLTLLLVVATSCKKEEKLYQNMAGTYTGDIAITGDQTIADNASAIVYVEGSDIDISLNYNGYNFTINTDILEVQDDKDILFQFPAQNITNDGLFTDIDGKVITQNVHGTFNYTDNTLAFAFDYSNSAENLEFYFIGTK